MAAPPKIATCPNTTDLITTAQLQGAYARACDPKLVETATRPLFEELLNEYLRSPSLSVFGEQQLDDDGQRVDIAVGFHDRNSLPNLVFVLLAETKRHKQTNRFEVEPQLEEYADRYLDQAFGGCAIHHTVFGAAAYGTKIRFFLSSRGKMVSSKA